MSRTYLWAWAGMVCLFCVGAVYAQQEVATVGSSSQPAVGSSSGVAAVPRLIKFSGAVRDTRGEPLNSVAARLTFSVYEEPTGGLALWAESQVAQLDEQGHYTVLLGATRADGLPVELFPAGKARWLGVQVEGRDEDPRVLLVSVPYALKAEDAAMLGGRQASDFVLGEQLKEEVRTQVAAQTPGIATQAVEMLTGNPPKAPAMTIVGPATIPCATSGNCLTVQQTGTGRAMSTSAVSSTDVVFVQQTGTGYGLWALAAGNVAVYGQITGSAGTSYGVKGQTTSSTGAGVFGYNLATTGLAYGVLGQTASTEGTAFFGRAVATTGATIGLRGHADSTSGTGIVGQATATSGTTTGILGRVFSAAGTALVVDNTQGGKLLSGRVNGTEMFSISGSGNVRANSYLDLAGNPIGGSGTVTSVASGTGLSGGPITTSGTLSLDTTYTDAHYALLAHGHDVSQVAGAARLTGGNTFTGNQTVTGSVTATVSVSAGNGIVSYGVSGTGGAGGAGVYGYNNASGGGAAGAAGVETASSGVTIGVYGVNWSPAGTAGVFDSRAGGDILAGQSSGTTKFRVDATGKVYANAYGGQTRGITYLAGCDTCDVLTDTDDQRTIYFNVIGPMTISSVTCFSDAGTPTINIRRDDGTPANILASDLTCSTTGTEGTSFSGSENVLNLSDKLDFVMVTAGGVAKRVTVVVKATLN